MKGEGRCAYVWLGGMTALACHYNLKFGDMGHQGSYLSIDISKGESGPIVQPVHFIHSIKAPWLKSIEPFKR